MNEPTRIDLAGHDVADTLHRTSAVLAAMQLGFQSTERILELNRIQVYGVWLCLGVCSDTLRRAEARLTERPTRGSPASG